MKSKGIMLTVLVLVIGAFLFSGCEAGKVKELQNEVAQLNQTIEQKDANIKLLADQVQSKDRELSVVKEELDKAKMELEALNQKFNAAAPAAVAAPAPAAAPVPPAAPAPAQEQPQQPAPTTGP